MLFKLVFTKCGCAIKQQKLFTIATPYLFRRSYVSTLKTIVKTPLNKSPKFNIHKLTPIRTGSNLYTKFFFFRFCSTSAKSASKDATSKSSLRRLLQLAKPERTRLFVAVFLLIISSGITLIIPYGIGQVIDIIYTTSKEKVVNDLTRFCQFLLLIFVIGGLANFGRITIMQTSGNRIVKKLKDDLFSSLVKQDISFFDKSKTGGLINRLSADTAMVGHTLTMNISDGLRSTTQAIGGISWMVYTSPQLAGVSLLAVIPLTLFTRGYGRFVKKISSDVQDSSAEASEVAEESLSSIRTVQSFVKEEKEMGDYRRKIEYVLSLSFKESLAKGVFWSMTGFSGNLIIVLVFYYGGLMVSKGQITVGELSSFLVYAAFVGVSFGGMTSFYTELMRGIGAGNRVFELLDRKPTISALGGLIPQAPPTGHISYHNVAFTYPERPDSPILTNFNLNLPAGSVTALVGPSGSGKSTVANLLLRFYDPLEGKVYLDETPVSDYNLHWLRDNISIVSQDPVLFSCSIADNIAYGAKEHSKVATSNIIQSAIKANAHQFIEKFPKGYETSVGEKGVMLSGGQKQRIAIARAIIKNPRILLLDEATSALDAESEHLVQEALVRVMEGRTVLVIAHRLSTIRRADQIAVLQGGKVIEMGAYEELMKLQGGEFRKLVERQTMGMVEG